MRMLISSAIVRNERYESFESLKLSVENTSSDTAPKGEAIPPRADPNPTAQNRGSWIPAVHPIVTAISATSGAKVVAMGEPPIIKVPSHVAHSIISDVGTS